MPSLADQFQAYVQQLSGQALAWVPVRGPAPPPYLAQRFEARGLEIAGRPWLAALLKSSDPPAPLQLRKHLQQLQERCAPQAVGICLVAEQLHPHLRRRLVELAQPFVVPGRQLFWPAIGSAETVQRPRRLRPEPVEVLGPVAQQLLIALLLRRLIPPFTIKPVAQALACSAASVSQAVKALEAGALVHSGLQGRERVFALAGAPADIWRLALPLLRTPVRQRIRIALADLPKDLHLRAGESALAMATGLADPAEPALAVASRRWNRDVDAPDHIPVPDAGTGVVELWRYPPEATAARQCVDPLSLYLSLRDDRDERVQLALQELMEQVEW